MRKIFILLLLMGMSNLLYAQNSLRITIRSAEKNEPLAGVTTLIKGLNRSAYSDHEGILILKNVPSGKQILEFKLLGFKSKIDTVVVSENKTTEHKVVLNPEQEEIEEVVVSTTRRSRSISDLPTRVEAISGEELAEKANMKPGSIQMLLAESTGIQVQQTSATSANATIRIQGMDGRYTQLLKDGFPVYSGFASGLSIMQIPPLDLSQVEVIKGSASTLYGGGAIAGLVNMISRRPEAEPEYSFMFNGTSAKGFDASGFYASQYGKTGVTTYAAVNLQKAYDPSNTGFSAIPQFSRFTINPRLYQRLSSNQKLMVGIDASTENRLGGYMNYISGDRNESSYYERNLSKRIGSQLCYDNSLKGNTHLQIKNAFSWFDRSIDYRDHQFYGNQLLSFSELTLAGTTKGMDWVTGLNLSTEKFNQQKIQSGSKLNMHQISTGGFVQNTIKFKDWFSLEGGLRTDVVNWRSIYHEQRTEVFVLPRVSAFFRMAQYLTSRLGGGLGYKTPTIFTEDAEKIGFRNLNPIDPSKVKSEHSYGLNCDFNYRGIIADKITVSLNQLFYYTYLNNPLVLSDSSGIGSFSYANANGHIDSRGFETNLKLGYNELKLFLGYSFTDAKDHFNAIQVIKKLTPKHRINTVLMYEKEGSFRMGLEAYYFSEQLLNNGNKGQPYWVCGFMAEKKFSHFGLFINFENFTDIRQTKFSTVYSGTPDAPVFADVYAPLDGFVVNGGAKLSF
ncbi:TonB-dependent receptor [Solitalea koreensis]|uniref:Iron complex outermembrane recepter protein n=1 Tax=Solitalea koreensis TaxID=543615 RepID=A0A521E8Y7_9SPHI|nr:TonB-dependent receptor plug domain-containing protein [Solitalea koreensis]SMO79911.1 iron complex outermembrane recepter protein [Solitalea koreensis]